MSETPNTQEIIKWLETLRFRKQWIGGINERDAWKKISELNELYEEQLKAERIRYDTLLDYYQQQRNKDSPV